MKGRLLPAVLTGVLALLLSAAVSGTVPIAMLILLTLQ
jgi:hypothetical protein